MFEKIYTVLQPKLPKYLKNAPLNMYIAGTFCLQVNHNKVSLVRF